MSNPIKYSTGSETLALKKGNFYIGTGDVGKGPTSSTGYYNGITPPSGGYTIYLNKETGGPSIYTVSNDTQLISLTNSIAGQSYTTANECLVYFAGQTDKMVLNRNYEGIVTDGLVLNLDAGFTPSYPTSGTTCYDLSGKGNDGALINGVGFTDSGVSRFQLDGTNDRINVPKDLNGFTHNIQYDIDWTIECWMYMYTPDSSPQTYKGIYGNYSGCNYSVYPGNAQGFIIRNANNPATVSTDFGFGPKSPSGCPDSVSWNNAESSWVYSLAINKWCNWVMTSNDGTTYRIYVNGVQRGSTKTFDFKNAASRTANNLTATSNYSWGGSHVSNEANEVDFSCMRIYNRALSSSEVLQNYNATKGRFGL
jgi:hypothetical protein